MKTTFLRSLGHSLLCLSLLAVEVASLHAMKAPAAKRARRAAAAAKPVDTPPAAGASAEKESKGTRRRAQDAFDSDQEEQPASQRARKGSAPAAPAAPAAPVAPLSIPGLTNIGNTCYFNATIQALRACPIFLSEFARYGNGLKESKVLISNKAQSFAQIYGPLVDLFYYMQEAPIGSAITREQCEACIPPLRNLIFSKPGDAFRQQDAHELLTQMFDHLRQTEIVKKYTINKAQTTTCVHGHASTKLDQTTHLQINIPAGIAQTSMKARLVDLFKPESIKNFECKTCKQQVDATQVVRLTNQPDLLVIQLSRFSHVGGLIRKDDTPVTISETLTVPCNGKDTIYNLKSVVLHNGKMLSDGNSYGHYTALVRNGDNQWLLCNDQSVSDVEGAAAFTALQDNGNVGDANAYLVFYERAGIDAIKPEQLRFNLTHPPVMGAAAPAPAAAAAAGAAGSAGDAGSTGSAKRAAEKPAAEAAKAEFSKKDYDRALNLHKSVDKNLAGAKLAGAQLQNCDLRNSNLSGADLKGADLTGAKLNNSNLTDADLRPVGELRTNLFKANLNDAKLIRTQLSHANLDQAKLEYAHITASQLDNAILTNAKLTGVKIILSNLSGANLEHAVLKYAKIFKSNLSGAQLSFATLDRALFSNSNLSKTTLHKNSATKTVFNGIKFHNATISEMKFDGVSIKKSTFDTINPGEQATTLSDLDFLNCCLENITMRNVQADLICFNATKLESINFSGATIKRLCIMNNLLLGTQLNFTGASIENSIFLGKAYPDNPLITIEDVSETCPFELILIAPQIPGAIIQSYIPEIPTPWEKWHPDLINGLLLNINFTKTRIRNCFWQQILFKNCSGYERISQALESQFLNTRFINIPFERGDDFFEGKANRCSRAIEAILRGKGAKVNGDWLKPDFSSFWASMNDKDWKKRLWDAFGSAAIGFAIRKAFGSPI